MTTGSTMLVGMTNQCSAEGCAEPLRRSSFRTFCDAHLDLQICPVEGCATPVARRDNGKGYITASRHCSKHYARISRYGTPEPEGIRRWVRRPRRDQPEKWLEWLRDCSKEDGYGCWVWSLTLFHDGYPSSTNRSNGSTTPDDRGHRVSAWAEEYVRTGVEPDMGGRQVDHQCHIVGNAPRPNRACVNPRHLRIRSAPGNKAEMIYRTHRDKQVRALVAELLRLDPTNKVALQHAPR